MQEARKKIRTILYIALLLIIGLLLLRFILEFARTTSPVVTLYFTLTQPLASFFETIIFVNTNISSIVAIAFFVITAYVVSKLIGGIEARSTGVQIRESIEALTRVLEFVILARIVFKLVGISPENSPFVGTIYLFTEWTRGLIGQVEFDFGALEVSSLIVLAVVIVIDISTEAFLNALKYVRRGRSKDRTEDDKANDAGTAEALTDELPQPEQHDELAPTSLSNDNDLQDVMTKLMPKNPPVESRSGEGQPQEG